ncbi:MAG: hypothetical protein KBC33_02690 [Candidatus Pacebacteria bacterium]|nr:hypothetical protein [Candidatus Paceibacterota bacterium]
MHSGLTRELLSQEERAKIGRRIEFFADPTALYGQFPVIQQECEAWVAEMQKLMSLAEENIRFILGSDEMKKYREWCMKGRSKDIAWKANQILTGEGASAGIPIWFFNPGNNQGLALIFIDGEGLVLCTCEYQYQTEHIQPFHWYRRHDPNVRGLYGLKVDSYRLYLVLKVLSDPESAWQYMRAHVHVAERSE